MVTEGGNNMEERERTTCVHIVILVILVTHIIPGHVVVGPLPRQVLPILEQLDGALIQLAVHLVLPRL
jgi:hypothetical protein